MWKIPIVKTEIVGFAIVSATIISFPNAFFSQCDPIEPLEPESSSGSPRILSQLKCLAPKSIIVG